MNWFNPYGLGFMAIIMLPNILYAVKCKDGFENLWDNKTVLGFATLIENRDDSTGAPARRATRYVD